MLPAVKTRKPLRCLKNLGVPGRIRACDAGIRSLMRLFVGVFVCLEWGIAEYESVRIIRHRLWHCNRFNLTVFG